jgi:hypothetical protein
MHQVFVAFFSFLHFVRIKEKIVNRSGLLGIF